MLQGAAFFVHQALTNLRHNAVERTPPSGTITLTVQADVTTVTRAVLRSKFAGHEDDEAQVGLNAP